VECEKNPSRSLVDELDKRCDAYVYLCDCVKEKYGDPSPPNSEDELYGHPYSHDPLL
jgi:hypothetical protein